MSKELQEVKNLKYKIKTKTKINERIKKRILIIEKLMTQGLKECWYFNYVVEATKKAEQKEEAQD